MKDLDLDSFSISFIPVSALLYFNFIWMFSYTLITFETGLYDELGTPRKEFALSEVFDTHLKPGYKGPIGQVFYASIEREHEILKDFSGIDRLPGGEFFVPVESSGKHVLNIVPPYPNGIPEMVYPYPRKEMDNSNQQTDNPAVIIKEKGNSRLIYFPTDIDKNVWTRGSVDQSKLLQRSIRWMMKSKSPVTVEGDGYVEIFAWETEPGFAIHVLNYNNPNMTKASICLAFTSPGHITKFMGKRTIFYDPCQWININDPSRTGNRSRIPGS